MLWVLLYCYTTMVALLFQKLILPMFPGLHAGNGLIISDASHFHEVAGRIADQIHANGWSFSAFWPDHIGTQGNVAILGLLYTLFGKDPSLIIPVNAVFHATSGLLLLRIARILWPGRSGYLSGVVAAVLFVCFPSTLNWCAQVHKDGYVIAGVLLIIYAWVWFFKNYALPKAEWKLRIYTFIGSLLVLFVRPYNLIALSTVIGFFVLIHTGAMIFKRALFKKARQIRGFLLAWVMLVLFAKIFGFPATVGLESKYNLFDNWDATVNKPCATWKWEQTHWVPDWIESPMKIISRNRAGLICHENAYDAFSTIDRDVLPKKISEVLRYAPRALQIAIFSPFPTGWSKELNIVRMVGLLEISCWYCLLPGVFVIIRKNGIKTPTFFLIFFSMGFLWFYGFSIANVGSLHRVRYPYLSLLMMLGISGWIHLVKESALYECIKRKVMAVRNGSERKVPQNTELLSQNENMNRQNVLNGGILVGILMLLSYLGFFLRDIIMARQFGLGDHLDAFFIAMLIPMFIVNVFCQSYGTATVPLYLRAGGFKKSLSRYLSFRITIALLIISFALLFSASTIIKYLAWNFSVEKQEFTRNLFYLGLPLLFFSGVVILGNNLLSANMKFAAPAWSQLIVPVFSITFLICLGNRIGIQSVLWGMVAGQIFNLLLVEFFLRKEQLSILPSPVPPPKIPGGAGVGQMFVLMLSAVFVQATLIINQGMASMLPPGSVAAYGLGFKAVLFVTGIISAAVSFVVFPYFSRFIVKGAFLEAERELAALLMGISIFLIPVSLCVYLVGKGVLSILFLGGVFQGPDIDQVSAVMEMGIIQLPFFSAMLALIKFEIALGRNRPIYIAAFITMLMNIFFNHMFIGNFGVSGIALANTMAVLCGAICQLFFAWWGRNIDNHDAVSIILSWIIYLTLVLCVTYKSFAGVLVSGIALFMLSGSLVLKLRQGSISGNETG